MTPRLGKMVAVGAFAGSLALLGMQSVSGVALASGTNPRTASLTAPSYLTTLAGASIANMYSSGFAWDPVNHRIVVADTGNNRIEFYSATGTRLGAFRHLWICAGRVQLTTRGGHRR